MLHAVLLSLLVAPAAAFVATAAPRPSFAARSPMAPQMFLDAVSQEHIQPLVDSAPSLLLAKSEADELLEEIFGTFPTAFTGLCLGAFAVEYAKNLKPAEIEDLPAAVTYAVVPGVAIAFVVLAKVGVVGTVSGLFAKALLDGWNLFAGLVLPGALLKY